MVASGLCIKLHSGSTWQEVVGPKVAQRGIYQFLELMAISICILSLRPPCYSHVNFQFHNSTPCFELSICDHRAAPSLPTSTVLGPGTTMLVLSSTGTTGATTGHGANPCVVSGSCREVIVSWLQAGWTSTINLCSSLQPSTGFSLKSSALQVYTPLPS
jgi:hypothetical protein